LPRDTFARLIVKIGTVQPANANIILSIGNIVIGEYPAEKLPFEIKLSKKYLSSITTLVPLVQACVSLPGGRCCISVTPKFELDSSCDDDPNACGIKEFAAQPVDCANDGSFRMTYKFSGENKWLSGYYIYVNDQRFGPFRYAVNGGTVGPIKPNNDGYYRVVMSDVENPRCADTVEIKKFFCKPCSIRDLAAAYIICEEENQDIFTLNLLSGPTVDTGYVLTINGIEIGTFSLKKMPLRISISKAIPNLINDVLKVQVCLPGVEKCCLETVAKIIRVKSCAKPENLCPIKEVKAIATGCGVIGKYQLEVNASFNEQLLTSDRVFIKVEGKTFGPFKPASFPIKLEPLELLVGGIVPLKIQLCTESLLDTCCVEIIPNVNNTGCDCKLELSVAPLECSGDKYYVTVKVEGKNGSQAGYYILGPDGKKYGPYSYEQRSKVLGPFTRATTSPRQVFFASDMEKPCADTVVLESIVCASDTLCRVRELKVVVRGCSPKGGYDLLITPLLNLNPSNLLSTYYVYIENKKYGPFKLLSTPQLIENVVINTDALTFEVKVCVDGQSEKCCVTAKVEKPKCPECELGELVIKTAPCNDKGEVYAYLDFKHCPHQFRLFCAGTERQRNCKTQLR
jgi:hypothetical protein